MTISIKDYICFQQKYTRKSLAKNQALMKLKNQKFKKVTKTIKAYRSK